jgi:hypothetical protein
VRFELRNKEDDSDESSESYEEVEKLTQIVRMYERVRKPVERYSLPNFFSTFVLTPSQGAQVGQGGIQIDRG